MNTRTITAAALITLGIIVLAGSGISFTTPGESIRFLGLHIETTDTHFVPPVAGVFCLIGGTVLLGMKPRST